MTDDDNGTAADPAPVSEEGRLALIKGTKQVLANVLEILGIDAPERM